MDKLATMSKEELLAKARNMKNRLANVNYDRKQTMGRVLGHLSAQFGGAIGAVAKKYLPGVIPGDAATDDLALYGSALLLDLAVMAMGDMEYSDEANFMAAGYEGYIAGSQVEKILP